MTTTAELIDRAASLPPGADLAVVLARLPWDQVPNARMVEMLRARSRQLAHDQAQLWAGLVEVSRAVALEELPGTATATTVERSMAHAEWAGGEIAAGLTWTRTAAERELVTATEMVEGLPLVHAALCAGAVDRSKAMVFLHHLDPGGGDLTTEQIRYLCERFVPPASGWTTKQLGDRLRRAVIAIDPEFHRRRYERAVRQRGVVCYLDPRTGTATLTGTDLPVAEAAAAVARLDRLAEAVKRAGHPGRLQAITADVCLGMLNGEFESLTEDEIITRLVDSARTETADAEGVNSASDTHDRDSSGGSADEFPEPPDPAPSTVGWAATREGVEIRAGLATLAGLDDRPGEIPGLGPVGADIARMIADRQHRGAQWQFALVGADGHLLLAGALRRRPRNSSNARVRGGVVEVHLTLDELHAYRTDPDSVGAWAGVLGEIAEHWRNRDALRRRLATDPRARFARGALARHLQVRDRTCVGIGCTRSARRSDIDHTRDHAFGGRTVEDNLGPLCRCRHHRDKDRGWRLCQPEPGLFRWTSPLGRTYETRGEPIRPDLPDPLPRPDPEPDIDANPVAPELRILWRPANNPPRPPPVAPDEPDSTDEPPF